MRSLNPPLTKDDFLNSSWQDAIDSSESKECRAYYAVFSRRVQELGQAGNEREQAVFDILETVSLSDINSNFDQEHISVFVKLLTPEDLDFLAEIATEVSDPELQARITDILWSSRRNYRMAQLAVDAYLKSATILEDLEEWTWCFNRIARALHLSHKINYHREIVVAHIEAVLSRYNGEDPSWLSAKLMELLQGKKLGSPTQYAALAEKAAKLAETNCDWRRARKYWEIKARWHLIEKDGEKERAAALLAAETYIKEAEESLREQPPIYLRASSFIEQAVEAFRSVRGTKEETVEAKKRAEETHKILIEYQEKSCQERVSIYSRSVDISNEVERARKCVRGKNLQDALFALAIYISPVAVSQLRQGVQQGAKDFIAPHLSSKAIVNKMGKVTAQQPGSILSTDAQEAEEAMRFEMHHAAILYQDFYAQALIEPARKQINLEHSIEIKDLLTIISDSPFVPPDREHLFAKGLYAGLIGDFITSTHVLIPQIENSVRYLLSQRGVITSSLEKGIQNEHDLNKILYQPEIKDIFDEDTLFDLKGLLVEHSGTNLRNRMAHGLINDREFNTSIMSYLWWVTLRLCCLPMYIYQQQVKRSDPWVQFAGIFKDDPLFDEFVEAMAEERRKLDAEMAAYDAANEENQPA